MNTKDLKKLKLNDRVKIVERGGHTVTGTVSELGYSAVRVAWEDGVSSLFQFDSTERQGCLPEMERMP